MRSAGIHKVERHQKIPYQIQIRVCEWQGLIELKYRKIVCIERCNSFLYKAYLETKICMRGSTMMLEYSLIHFKILHFESGVSVFLSSQHLLFRWQQI